MSQKEIALEKAKRYWNLTERNPCFSQMQEMMQKCEEVYNGNTWGTKKDPKNLNIPILKGYVLNLIGEQLKTQTAFSVRSREYTGAEQGKTGVVGLLQEEVDAVVTAHNALMYRISEQSSVGYHSNQCLEDMFVFGLSGAFFDYIKGDYSFRRINPYYLLPDFSDETLGFENSEYVGMLMPMNIKEAIATFPALSEYVGKQIAVNSGDSQNWNSARQYMLTGGNAINDGRTVFLRFVEWKEMEKSYSCVTEMGRKFTVFDEELAVKFAYKRSAIVEGKSDRIHRAIFVGDGVKLLSHTKLSFFQPRKEFSITLSSLRKKPSENNFYIPFSLVEPCIDVCHALDLRHSKSAFLSDAKKLLIDPDSAAHSFNSGDSSEIIQSLTTTKKIETDLAKSISVTFIKTPNESVKDISLQQDVQTSLGLAQEYMRVLDFILGIFREQRGEQSNAVSGIAIKTRQVQSITSHLYAFNEFSHFKLRIGRLFLQTIQMNSLGKDNIPFPKHPFIGDPILLNEKNKKERNQRLMRDINFIDLDLYIEESPDYLTTKEEQRELLVSILQSPMADILLQSPSLMKMLGINLDSGISQEITQIMAQRAQMQSMAKQPVSQSSISMQG